MPAGDRLRAVQPDRRRGQAAVRLRRPRPRRRAIPARGRSSTSSSRGTCGRRGRAAWSSGRQTSTSTGSDTLDALAGYPACPEIDSAAAPEHGLRDPLRRAAHQPRPVSPVRLPERAHRARALPGHLLRAEVPERAGDHPPGHGEPAAQPLRHLRAGRAAGNAPPTRPTPRCSPVSSPTGSIEAESYVFRGIVADSVRGLQFLLDAARAGPRARGRGRQRRGADHRRAPARRHPRRVRARAVPRHGRAGPPHPRRTRWRRSTTTCGPSPSARTRCAGRSRTTTSWPSRRA